MSVWFPIRSDATTIATAIFFPAPGVYETYGVQRARFVVELDGTDIEVAPAVQYSDDGIHWYDESHDPIDLGILNTYNGKQSDGSTNGLTWIRPKTTDGGPDAPDSDRTVLATWADLPTAFRTPSNSTSGATLTERLFCRFGLLVKRQSGSSAYPRGGVASLTVEVEPTEARSVTAGPVYAPSGGGEVVVTTPLTPWMTTADLASVRPSWELEAADAVEVQLGYQISDDGVNVAGSDNLGSTWTSGDGLHFGTSFQGFTAASGRLYVRFTARVRNVSSGDGSLRGAMVALRLDMRP